MDFDLSFDTLKEAERTKHVHGLHPYKGKFIPQLVEYFLSPEQGWFHEGDVILDPFCGSGTTLVQANEMSINAIGVEISKFNTLISNCKLARIDIHAFKKIAEQVLELLQSLPDYENVIKFEKELGSELKNFNHNIHKKAHLDKEAIHALENAFLPTYKSLASKSNIDTTLSNSTFIQKWFLPRVQKELYLARDIICTATQDEAIKNILLLTLSRTMRSCRATTHSDLATLVKPVSKTYYCAKHSKLCKPIYTITNWWRVYVEDTAKRLSAFDAVRTNTEQICITGDSKTIDLTEILNGHKVDGVITSPPYLGLIDYHEQHAYAYELFGFERADDLEIGSMKSGQTKKAQEQYIEDIAAVLKNCKRVLKSAADVFVVANDKFNLYPSIVSRAEMEIVEKYERPVLKRSERNSNPYSETIFHIK